MESFDSSHHCSDVRGDGRRGHLREPKSWMTGFRRRKTGGERRVLADSADSSNFRLTSASDKSRPKAAKFIAANRSSIYRSRRYESRGAFARPWTRSRLSRQAVADKLEPNRYQPFRHGGVGTYGLDEWLARSSRNAATSPSTIASRVGCSFGSQRGECRSATTPWSRSCSGSEAPMCRRTAFTPARP
jgi:hypothetical protein